MRILSCAVVVTILAGCAKSEQPAANTPEGGTGTASPSVTAAPDPTGEAAGTRDTGATNSASPQSPPNTSTPSKTPDAATTSKPAGGAADELQAASSISLFKNSGHAFAITPDGNRLVMAGRDDKDDFTKTLVRLYDVADGKIVKEWTTETGGVLPLAISPDGQRVVYGGITKTTIADSDSGEAVGELKTDRESGVTLHILQFTADGKSLYAACGKELVEFDGQTGADKRGLTSGESLIESFALFPEGTHAAVGYRNGGVRVFDLATGEARILDPGSEKEPSPFDTTSNKVLAFAATKDGRQLVVSRIDHDLELWDLEKGEKVRSFPVGKTRSDSLALAGDERIAIAQGRWLTPDGKSDYDKRGEPLHAFETDTGRRVAYLKLPGSSLLDGHVWNMVLSADGKRLFVGVSNGTVQVFDLSRWTASGT